MSVPAQRIVLITGAAGGLGRALTEAFLREEWRAIVPSRGELDVANSEAVQKFVSDLLTQHGRIDCLINNAGITADALTWQLEDNDWERVMDVNLHGAFFCARAVARQMAKQREGHIINISSFGGQAGARGQSNYAASKAGLIGLTQSIAKELGSRNVRVNAVLPGVLPTKMTARLTPEQLEEFARANALGRINSLEEVARFIVFLASTQNISGQVFQLDSRIAPWT
jgi:NAD(P)-dependent dehydrogenase (short-subunit alcohol dehydrogenase family)